MDLETALGRVKELEAAIASYQSRVAELEREATERMGLEQKLSVTEERMAAQTAAMDQLKVALTAATEKYRAAVLASVPDIPPELVTGNTIEEVDRSLESARRLVEKIREGLTSSVRAAAIPNGVPSRTGPDLSAMSPAEKIRYGLAHLNGRA